jgi:pimeloyl-ACP methyl ester carboxylesterase
VLKGDVDAALAARPGAKLIFAGHSLGGALAVIAASDAKTDAAAVYTFGMPRAGNAGFVAGYNGRLGDRTFRLVYGNDIVPMVPAEPFGHVGRYLHSQGGVFEPSLLTENPKMLPREQWSNDPEFDMALQNSLAALEAAPALTLSSLMPGWSRCAIALPLLIGRCEASTGRQDGAGG